ncbi:EF-hand domain-containing protein [Billgrantia antri]|uniref:EF-hand domain-containing protein n=1 Tax=Billgrantia antri TaxID=2846777 RepID=A0ABS6ZJ04_9GAMM|nr:EF-hand domain-containing protein [Halomonas antri]MBW6390042.1 EF-hand domain-containing protein [Halomonas antri]
MKLRTLALLLTLALAPVTAFADRPSPEDGPLATRSGTMQAPMVKRHFEQLDADRDGRLNQAETVGVSLTDSFWELDRNRDGFLSRQEYDYHPN